VDGGIFSSTAKGRSYTARGRVFHCKRSTFLPLNCNLLHIAPGFGNNAAAN